MILTWPKWHGTSWEEPEVLVLVLAVELEVRHNKLPTTSMKAA